MAIFNKTRKILWGRAGNRCAICKHVLVVNSTPKNDESVIGEECHIVSGQTNGPRYDPTFTKEKLDSFENLMLLCRIHHKMIVIVEPGTRSIETARQIKRLSEGLGIKNIEIVGNKIRSERDKDFLLKNMNNFSFLGFLPFNENIIEADLDGRPPYEKDPEGLKIVSEMMKGHFN